MERFILNRNRQHITLEGITYTYKEISNVLANTNQVFLKDLSLFLQEWFNESPYITVQTSGSTGIPQKLKARKDQMMQSAQMTCSFLDLKKGDKALLCMPLQYIAGKMVVVRALIAELDLIVRTPSGHPLSDIHTPLHFAAMIPLQVFNSLQIPEEKEQLQQIKNLIIGGGAINKELENTLQKLPGKIYSTYGMTETLSHIALRKLNGTDASSHYIPFPSVSISLSEDNTLIINAPLVNESTLITNDVACLHPDGSFSIIGRKDNIINSGGIKIQTEEVEDKLRPHISVPFAITSVPHAKFGEVIVLLTESGNTLPISEIITILPKYQQPKYIHEVIQIPLTETGKINRAECRKMAINSINL